MQKNFGMRRGSGASLMSEKTIKIEVPVLARVEGEGALELLIENNQLQNLHLRIYEPPRFFEKFLEGRSFLDVPDIVARICGICPVAYQMSAVHAIEQIFKVTVSPRVRELRRLLYCGEWIESHALHIHLLALPDFLGFNNAIAMAEKHPGEVRRGLKIQDLGNRIVKLLGGRSVHPVGVKCGGFYKSPDRQGVKQLLSDIGQLKPEVESMVRWVASLEMPDDQQSFCCVALRHPDEYAMNEGSIVSSEGLNIDISGYRDHFEEVHQPHSTALYSYLDDEPYLVGPLARLNLNQDRLPKEVKALIADCAITFPSQNMFHSMLARAIEIYYALLEAERILKTADDNSDVAVDYDVKAGTGFGCTEAPRGILWHNYELDSTGHVVKAMIVPPTSQNQARIEQDLSTSLQRFGLDRDDESLRLHGEKVIRNYDPCISCATHFLRLKVNRT
jgi:sulfhydrogenase subunit alpha